MRLPGFVAGSSLYKTGGHYQMAGCPTFRGFRNVGIILAGSPERGMGVTTNFRFW